MFLPNHPNQSVVLCQQCAFLHLIIKKMLSWTEKQNPNVVSGWLDAFGKEFGLTQTVLGIIVRHFIANRNYTNVWIVINHFDADPCWRDAKGKSHLQRATEIYEETMIDGSWKFVKGENRKRRITPDQHTKQEVHVLRLLFELYYKTQKSQQKILQCFFPCVLACQISDYMVPHVPWIEVITLEKEAKLLFPFECHEDSVHFYTGENNRSYVSSVTLFYT